MTIRLLACLAGCFLTMALSAVSAHAMNAQKFTYGPDAAQFGELSVPDGAGPFPVVVLIHGGCWQASLPGLEQMRPIASDLRDDKVAVWNIEYRRLGMAGGGYPGTFLDIAYALDALRQLAPFNKLNLNHVVIVGHSAGGHLALWAAGRHRLPQDNPLYMPDPLPIYGVMSLAGIADLAAYRDHGPEACGGPATIDRLVGAGESADRPDPYADTSPAAMLPLNTTQVMVSGSLDPIVPQHFGDDYALKALMAGDKINSLNIEGIGHMEMIDPLTAAWAQIKAHLLTMFD